MKFARKDRVGPLPPTSPPGSASAGQGSINQSLLSQNSSRCRRSTRYRAAEPLVRRLLAQDGERAAPPQQTPRPAPPRLALFLATTLACKQTVYKYLPVGLRFAAMHTKLIKFWD